MGRLSDFSAYLAERIAVVSGVEQRLSALQEKYETFYSEVSRVRESELGQLTAHILGDREVLPAALREALHRAAAAAERDLDAQLEQLREEQQAARELAEEVRRRSAEAERAIRARSGDLDAEEERLKAQSAELLARIAEHNRRIREMGRGFGFFSNLLRMRRIARERAVLDEQQAVLAARIDALRARWAGEDKSYVEQEAALRGQWVEVSAEAAGLQTKLDYLEQARPQLVLRSTVERVLYERTREAPAVKPDDPACPRCASPNAATQYFCQICAQRLQADRPDLAGSIDEIAELNGHYERFSAGMKACQQIIGLVRGLASGLRAFSRSVDEMQATERRYPLPKLQIEVPAASRSYGAQLEALDEVVRSDLSLHPTLFSKQVKALIDQVFTEPRIQSYFETMGEELSRQAERQWG